MAFGLGVYSNLNSNHDQYAIRIHREFITGGKAHGQEMSPRRLRGSPLWTPCLVSVSPWDEPTYSAKDH
jgi:hypothetical protein